MFIGMIDMDLFDIDLTPDLDGAESVGAGSTLLEALSFFNIGKIPFMIIMTFEAFFVWSGSVIGNSIWNSNESIGIAVLVIIPSFLIGLFLTKILTTPLQPYLSDLNGESKSKPIQGKTGKLLGAIDNNIGQAEILVDDAVLLVYVKSCDNIPIEKGRKILVVDQSEDKKYYLVQEV